MGINTAKVVLYYPEMLTETKVPPYSLLYLASALRRRGHDTVLIDARFERDPLNKLNRECSDAAVVSISVGMNFQAMTALRASIVAKQNGCTVVWGGVYATFNHETLLKLPFLDCIVLGEGERSIVETAENGFANAPSVAYRKDGKITKRPSVPPVDINRYSPLPYDLIDMQRYVSSYRGIKLVHFISSRGCPFSCSFCYSPPFWNRKWRGLSVKNVLKEIDMLVERTGINGIYFLDDNFLVDMKRAKSIAAGLVQRGIVWACEARADCLDDSLVRLMKETGCYKVSIGAESGCQRLLNDINKQTSVEDIRRAARLLGRYGLRSEFYFMIGLIGERDEDLELTMDMVNYVERTCEAETLVRVAIPFFGTEYFNRARGYGFDQGSLREECSRFWDLNPPYLPWLSAGQNAKVRNISVISLMRYLRANYIRDMGIKNQLVYRVLIPLLEYRWKHRKWQWPLEYELYRWLRSKEHQRRMEDEISNIEAETNVRLSELGAA
ncbi:MAG: B12-binding domain-containing radical SAM protein [Candidatus Hadarchaeaceae archaeon]